MTALWHEQQQQIEKGKMTSDAFLDELEIFIAEQLQHADVSAVSVTASDKDKSEKSQFERLNAPCPSCGSSIIVTLKYSAVLSAGNFKIWPTIAGKNLTKNQVETIISKGKSAEIKGFTSKAGKPFSAFVVLKDKATGQTAFEFPPRK